MEGSFIPNPWMKILLSFPYLRYLYDHLLSAAQMRFIFRVAVLWNWLDVVIKSSVKPPSCFREDESWWKRSEESIGLEEDDTALFGTLPRHNSIDLERASSIGIQAIPRKRALLIGIPQASKLDCDRDVNAMRSLLVDVYEYPSEDIIILLESDELNDMQPTRDNIILQIKNLVKDAKENDRFFFYFSGHSDQEDTKDLAEEDRKNEFICTCDGKKIIDDELRELLVNPLPPSCTLTAIIDSCHSCTMLDLPHYRCNGVYVPWVNRGERRTDITWESNQRKLEQGISFDQQNPSSSSISSSNSCDASRPCPRPPTSTRKATLPLNTESLFFPDRLPTEEPKGLGRFVDSSPIEMYCSGFCRNKKSSRLWTENDDPKPHVICLSSSQDDQLTWDKPGGNSMTQILVNMLREDQRRSLEEVLTHISHTIHEEYLNLHEESRTYKKEWETYDRKRLRTSRGKKQPSPASPKKVEMHNFQTPQISSFYPLDMKTLFQP